MLIEEKLALNAQTEDDICPMCFTEWSKFIELTLVAILPCKHACCVKCMCSFQKSNSNQENNQEEEEEDQAITNCCTLCRDEFSPSYLEDIANKIVEEKKIEILFDYLERLPLNEDESKKLIRNLLLKNEFDLSKCENALFGMVGFVCTSEQDLSNLQKQEYFDLARAPVRKLAKEYQQIKQELSFILDYESEEWKSKYKQLEETKKQLNIARKNAANDIFERMNSTIRMGSQTEENSSVFVDFHGLYVQEAIEKCADFVLPMLPVLKKIVLITGYGLHSKNGEANLKEALIKFLKSVNVNCKEHPKNKGAICIFSD